MLKRVHLLWRSETFALCIAVVGLAGAGCNGGSGASLPTPPPGTSGNVYITDFTNNSISVFGQAANCNCPPAQHIQGNNTGLSGPMGIALDKAGNMYVANFNAGTVTKYPANANGNVAPSFTIAGLNQPIGVVVDGDGQVYVANSNVAGAGVASVQVFPAGSAVASQTITSVVLFRPGFITLDTSRDIWVTEEAGDSVIEFPNSANGSVPPANIINGTRTMLNFPQGIAFDVSGRLYVSINIGRNGPTNAVLVFGAGAAGNIKPLNMLCGSATAITNPVGVAVNAQGTLFVANRAVDVTTGSLLEFTANNIGGGPSCNGPLPSGVISGAASAVADPAGVALR